MIKRIEYEPCWTIAGVWGDKVKGCKAGQRLAAGPPQPRLGAPGGVGSI